jgi:glycosyltransferase involved in cell wall biosynthesis
LKVLHFVTGGFSGATQVAVDLCLASIQSNDAEVLLVLRRKRNTDNARVLALAKLGLNVQVVPGWSHMATIFALYKIAKNFQPDILAAHGFSEHLWGRYAGLLANVPHLVHIEHNSKERYSRWQLWQAKWLARRTAAIVGVSEGVRNALLERGFPAEICKAIPNGINLDKFQEDALIPWDNREHTIIMASRFARQKDQSTLIEALGILKLKGIHPKLEFAGLGKKRLIKKAQQQTLALNIQQQVQFLGQVKGLPSVLMNRQIFILSTHYEGMPLALVEAMAAGCACIGTNVVGVREVIDDGINGLLVPENDAQALADAIEKLITKPKQAHLIAQSAREKAIRCYGMSTMYKGYATLFREITGTL